MQATDEDYDSIIALSERCFPRDRELGGMLPRWGHCFRREKVSNSLVMRSGGKVVAHVGCVDQEVMVQGGTIRVAGISSVATDPEFRGRGLMTILLTHATGFMRSSGYPLSDLGGDRLRYGRFGWETAGIKWEFGVSKRSVTAVRAPGDFDVGAWHGTDGEVRDTLRRHNAGRFGLKRDVALHRILLSRHGKTVLVARRDSRIDSYCVVAGDEFSGGQERRHCQIDELAGTAKGIHAILLHLLCTENYERVSVPMPWSHPLNGPIRNLSSGWSTGPWRMLKILSFSDVLRCFQAQMAQRLRMVCPRGNLSVTIGIRGEDRAVRLEVCGDEISIRESAGAGAVRLTEREAVLLLFGPTPPDILARFPQAGFIQALFPLDFHLWANETV